MLKVENLTKKFKNKINKNSQENKKYKKHTVVAANNIHLQIKKGDVLGLVGGSGSGKSTLGKLICQLIEPDKGKIFWQDNLISKMNSKERSQMRPKIQMIFQDPLASLDPNQKIKDAIWEPIQINQSYPTSQKNDMISKALFSVGLEKSLADRFPKELSGGQRQRVCIARALILKPDLLIADEPVSSLDASVQAELLSLLKRLNTKHNLTMLFISHNLAIVSFLCNKIAVMNQGYIVEQGLTEDIFHRPQDPYTQKLIQACTF